MFKPAHEEPGRFLLDYIMLPYGEFYKKTKDLLDAKPGDILRFFNGPDCYIKGVGLMPVGRTCDLMCMMRYGITWDKALARWLRYARMEGHGKNIFSNEKCIIVFYSHEKD